MPRVRWKNVFRPFSSSTYDYYCIWFQFSAIAYTAFLRKARRRERKEEKMVVSSSSLSSPPFQSLSSLLSTKPFHSNNKSQPSICVSARFRASADVPDFLSADWYFFRLFFFLQWGCPFLCWISWFCSILSFFFSRVCLKLIDVIGRNLGCFAFSWIVSFLFGGS